ncbi:MAG TPA: hypothetical protein VFZ75_03550 [Actinomycetota bacterium]|nr:hypothetical protein [Actinomycetota bacterium]
MDEAFAFEATTPIRRKVDPRIVRAAVVGALVVLGIVLFARWVIASERQSLARTHHEVLPGSLEVRRIPGAAGPAVTDDAARESLRLALAAARIASSYSGSFLEAGPGHLAALQRGYTFVDGPSTIPRVVSVAATDRTWAAAVRAPSGTCYWIRIGRAGPPVSGITRPCTGAAALRAAALPRLANDRGLPLS